MKLIAIMNQLKTGSIKAVFAQGNYDVYPSGSNVADARQPYIVIGDGYNLAPYYANDNTVRPFVVDVHFPPGNTEELEEYIEHEVIGLLHRKRLTDTDGTVFQIYATSLLSTLQEPNDDRSISGGNDDKTISKTRTFIVPRRGM